MVQSICNFCTKFEKTYRCKMNGMDYDFHACRRCIRTLPFQLIAMEAFDEDETESQGGDRLSLDSGTE